MKYRQVQFKVNGRQVQRLCPVVEDREIIADVTATRDERAAAAERLLLRRHPELAAEPVDIDEQAFLAALKRAGENVKWYPPMPDNPVVVEGGS